MSKKRIRLPQLVIQHRWLLVFASIYLGVCLNMSLWRYLYDHLAINNFGTALSAVSFPILLFAVVFLFLNITALPYLTKPILLFLFLCSSVANFMMFQYGIQIDSDMIRNIFETNTREALDLMTLPMILCVLLTGVLPAVLLAYSRIQYRTLFKEICFRVCMVLLCVVVIVGIVTFSYKDYASFGRNNSHVNRMLSPFNYLSSTARYFKKQALAKRQFEILDAKAKHAPYADPYPTVFIFIVGETARSDHFSLNGYERKTNLRLEQEDIINFGNVYACGTATAISVPCIFSAKPRMQFDSDDEKKTQNLLDLDMSAGYTIWWRENDDGCKGVCNHVNTENINPKTNALFCDGKSCFDEVLLENLEDYLMTVTKDTFIVLHTIGSHGPTYHERYPDSFRVFTPTCDTADLQSCSKEAIINTYDNTIVYTDHVIAETIKILKRFPHFESGLLYVSDHGESLGEKNIYLHGLPYVVAPEQQKKVPMLLWMSKNMIKYDHLDYQCIQKNAASNTYSHDNLFHTLLGIAEINTALYDVSLDILNECRLEPLPNCGEEGVKCEDTVSLDSTTAF